MRYLDLTLATPAENLALDEALLEQSHRFGDVLRLWENPQLAVVVGRSSQVDVEVNRMACEHSGVPIVRRCSGGASVVVGPGCLQYSLVLRTADRSELQSVDRIHCWVLTRIRQALSPLGVTTELAGTSDLTLAGCKFSGNSLRCCRDVVLYHGTLLYNISIARIESYLAMPPRQPEYRQGRAHRLFLTNLPLSAGRLREALRGAWQCRGTLDDWPTPETERLVRERYALDSWNLAR